MAYLVSYSHHYTQQLAAKAGGWREGHLTRVRFGKALQSQGQKACLVCRIVRSRRVSSISMASSSARTAEALPRTAERQSFPKLR